MTHKMIPNKNSNQSLKPESNFNFVNQGMLIMLYRTLLVVCVAFIGWPLGVLVGQFFPNPNTKMPLSVSLFTWLTSSSPNPEEMTPINVPSNLAQRAKFNAELEKLEVLLNQMRERTTAIETQLGTPKPNTGIEVRLKMIKEGLQNTSNDISGQKTSAQPLARSGNLAVSLPSAILFMERSSNLRPEGRFMINQILNDVNSNKGSKINIGVHTYEMKEPIRNLDLSFRRAKTLERYLTQTLGNDQHKWVVIGYGQSRPLVGIGADVGNERVEIHINHN